VDWKYRCVADHVVFDLTWLGISIVAAIGAVLTARMYRNTSGSDEKITKKRFALLQKYSDELEEDNNGYEKQLTSYKAKLAQKERAPSIPNEKGDDWSSIIPDFVGDISGFLPKKLQPLFENKELQQVIIKKVLDNPEKFKPYIDKFISKTLGKTEGSGSDKGEGL